MGEEVETFLSEVLPKLNRAEVALHSGDASLRNDMWSHDDPVTLFGAVYNAVGWTEIEPVFGRLASSFSNFKSFENEIIAAGASGDLAYIVAFEHTTTSVNGGPPTPYILRVTTVFRREDGEWRVVHRHGDPASDTAVTHATRIRP